MLINTLMAEDETDHIPHDDVDPSHYHTTSEPLPAATTRTFVPHGGHTQRRSFMSPRDDSATDKLTSLSDLIRREARVAGHSVLRSQEGEIGDLDADGYDHVKRKASSNGAVGTQEALQAAEHGNSDLLSRFLQDGGDPRTSSRLHHMRWSLLHLAAGCAGMGGAGALSFAHTTYRNRPEPDCNNGYAACISLLLAAGADPNVTSIQGGYTPLMGTALSGSTEGCWLLIRAGASPGAKTDAGQTAFDFARMARIGGRSLERLLQVLQDPPELVPRSPLQVTARLVDRSLVDDEDEDPVVEVRWHNPTKEALGSAHHNNDANCYVIMCYSSGVEARVVRTITGNSRKPRRDFCTNGNMDRGIALRRNLCLPPPLAVSAVIHNLRPGQTYSFTVSIVAEVAGKLHQSPPSMMTRSLLVPTIKDDDRWTVGGVFGKMIPKPDEGWQPPPGSNATALPRGGGSGSGSARVPDLATFVSGLGGRDSSEMDPRPFNNEGQGSSGHSLNTQSSSNLLSSASSKEIIVSNRAATQQPIQQQQAPSPAGTSTPPSVVALPPPPPAPAPERPIDAWRRLERERIGEAGSKLNVDQFNSVSSAGVPPVAISPERERRYRENKKRDDDQQCSVS